MAQPQATSKTIPPGEAIEMRDLAETAASSTLDAKDDISRPELPPWRLALLGIGVSVGLFLSFLDTSIIATSLFAIGTEFDDLESVNWVALAYTLAYLGCAVFLARMSDVIGRRDAFLVSYGLFIAFSIGCGFAQSMTQLIALRVLQGIGGSGLYSITMIVVPELCPPRLAHLIGTPIGIVITISSVLGPVLGGIFTQYATWRWVFWINGPVGIVSMLLVYFMWPKPQYLPDQERRSWKELDYFGSILLMASAILIVFPFQNAGRATDQWSQPIFIAPIVIGVVALLGSLAWSVFVERRWGDFVAAALPMRLLRNRVYASAAINTMFLGFPYILTIYAFPLKLQVVNGKDALMAGVMLLPMLGSSAVGSGLSGKLNAGKDRTFPILVVAACLMLLGCGLLSTLSSSPELEPKALGFLVFVGLGFGLSVATTTMMAVFQSSLRDHAVAQGIVAQVRVLGGSIGIAASSAILGVALRQQLGGSVSKNQLASLEGSDTGLTEAQLRTVRQAYSDAFNTDMRVCSIIAGVGILFALGTFSRNPPAPAQRREQHEREEVERRQAAGQGRCTRDSCDDISV